MNAAQHGPNSETIIASAFVCCLLTIFGGVFLVYMLIQECIRICKRKIVNVLWPLNTKLYSDKWNRVEQLFKFEHSRPFAVIYASSLLDHALKERKYPGETMYERLMSVQYGFTKKKQMWDAYRLRNQIAHDIDIESLPKIQIKQALQAFRQALDDMGAL